MLAKPESFSPPDEVVAGRGAVAELLLAEDTVTELLLAVVLLQDSIGKRLLQKR